MKVLLRYPGSKWRIANWIISYFPKHHSYLEPFSGSGAVLFNKPPSNIETVNDLNLDIVNFFQCIRENPERLAKIIEATPYSRYEYDITWNTEVPDCNYERARELFESEILPSKCIAILHGSIYEAIYKHYYNEKRKEDEFPF